MVVWTTLLACLLHFLNEVFAMCHYSTEVFSGMIEHCDSIEELKKEILPHPASSLPSSAVSVSRLCGNGVTVLCRKAGICTFALVLQQDITLKK